MRFLHFGSGLFVGCGIGLASRAYWSEQDFRESEGTLKIIHNACSRFTNHIFKPGIIWSEAHAAEPIFPSVPPEPPKSNRTAQIMRFGYPSLDNVISRRDYIISYDRRNRIAHWVFEHLTKESIKRAETVSRHKCQFVEDPTIHRFFRATNTDYKGTGYDRGHLAAAGNHCSSQEVCDETFFLSNVAPSVGKGFNRDTWNRLEMYVRRLTNRREADGRSYVMYEVLGANHVAVPTHLFKIIVGETEEQLFDMEAYVLPNTSIEDDVPLHAFQVPVEVIERSAGLLFFDRLPRKILRYINGATITHTR